MLDRADTSAAPVQYRHATALVQRDAERRAAVAEAAHMVRQSKWSDRSEVQEFVAVKQGNALRGSYMRIIEIGPRGICTLDPSTRRLTNRWPLTRVVRVTADDQCGVDLLLSEPVGGLFCLPLAVERRVSFALATPGESAQLLETIRAQRVVVQALQCFEQRSLIRESPDEALYAAPLRVQPAPLSAEPSPRRAEDAAVLGPTAFDRVLRPEPLAEPAAAPPRKPAWVDLRRVPDTLLHACGGEQAAWDELAASIAVAKAGLVAKLRASSPPISRLPSGTGSGEYSA